MSDGFTETIKTSKPKRGMQVTLDGGPMHGQVIDWPESGTYRMFPMAPYWGGLDLGYEEGKLPTAAAFSFRKVVYELDRWNEAHTAGIAKCVDDGKPKCKNQALCYAMDKQFRTLRDVSDSSVEVVKTKGCGSCSRPLAFEVRQRT